MNRNKTAEYVEIAIEILATLDDFDITKIREIIKEIYPNADIRNTLLRTLF